MGPGRGREVPELRRLERRVAGGPSDLGPLAKADSPRKLPRESIVRDSIEIPPARTAVKVNLNKFNHKVKFVTIKSKQRLKI